LEILRGLLLPLEIKGNKTHYNILIAIQSVQTRYIFVELKVPKLLFSVEQQVFLDCSTLKMKGAT
jgi:hypothetical protein